MSASLGLAIPAPLAHAAAPTASTKIGDTVTHPTKNQDFQVIDVIQDGNGNTIYAIVSDGSVITTQTEVGDIIKKSDGDYKVISVVDDPTTGQPATLNIRKQPETDPPAATVPQAVATASGADFGLPADKAGAAGAPEVIPPQSTSGVINEVRRGRNGDDGNDGFGVEVCDPFGVLGCATIGYSGTEGDNGQTPGDFNRTISSEYNGGNPITSTADNTAGITIGSVGGNGGQGGDFFGNQQAKAGGDGGAGGKVTVNNYASVNVGDEDTVNSPGLYVFSRAGNAGSGGKGWLFARGGKGGAARSGGRVEVNNHGTITTTGNGGHAIRAFSSGGSAGSGGGSWGIVGGAGNGAVGGNGGQVIVRNYADLTTNGNNAHGILAQSIGGTGGDAGAAGGLFASGGNGSAGGNGNTVYVENRGTINTSGDDARGIMAQSIGGGGGSGGGAGGLVALGGSGGAAGNGNTVTVRNYGDIHTRGKRADAIYAQSIGGGGGSGGGAGGLVGSGRRGGGGGTPGTVDVRNEGNLRTEDNQSRGIFAQSIGGGGGSGGGSGGLVALAGNGGGSGSGQLVKIVNTGSITTGLIPALHGRAAGTDSDAIFAQSIGGGGGDGASSGGLVADGAAGGGAGNGGTVEITNSGQLTTYHHESSGIFAQSIGGGGGSGGGAGGLVALGGGGSAGGSGGKVTITNNAGGNIVTFGDRSEGIFAQSIGGGGGTGAGAGALVALGGAGGGAGAGNEVKVYNHASITTLGTNSRGISAQSIGGGGGAGAGSGGLVALAGSGGGASNGGAVRVENSGVITTGVRDGAGSESDGIFAQSIGGGGGSGAGSGGLVSGGSGGGGGGAGNRVDVINSGAITTFFNDSYGIFAQSVGGGGGSGAGSGGLVAMGGSGSAGGNGGVVTVTNNAGGIISTYGDRSGAIHAQSVGGGGGNGSGSGGLVALSGAAGGSGNGAAVTVNNKSFLNTSGNESRGIFAQSIGGGGGSGGASGGLVGLSSGGGGAGNGNKVDVDNTANIFTGIAPVDGLFNLADIIADNTRFDADAIFAQSVGGGGGAGGAGGGVVAVNAGGGGGGNGGVVEVDNSGWLITRFANSNGIFAQSIGGGGGSGRGAGGLVAIGGNGSDGGDGQNVTVNNSGDIDTFGKESRGIFAQSIGGGGGAGSPSGGLVALGGKGSGGGVSGIVRVTNSGDIHTRGEYSQGILAQSIAGGGGAGGDSGGLVAIGGSSTRSGDSKAVTVTNNGNITTEGNSSDGIMAQSIGGGGGNAGSAGGPVSIGGSAASAVGSNAGKVTVNNTKRIETYGLDSRGIFAQSIGGGGGNGGSAYSGSAFASVGVGGNGGAGGRGGEVEINLDRASDATAQTTESLIYTEDDRSTGIFAQSVGGSGGSGGDAYSISAGAYGSASVAVGGNGGGGGLGGDVALRGDSKVRTDGDMSTGILLQSVGGGGGNGGMSVAAAIAAGDSAAVAASVSLGGNAGPGNDGGKVVIDEADLIIETRGEQSTGLIAQSVGGGGGNGGMAVAASVAASGGGSGAVSVGLGGRGEKGGVGGEVDVDFSGSVLTSGNLSDGVLIQSVGGGGGNGGMSIAAGLAAGGTAGGTVGVGLGGSAGEGGHGGLVTADIRANVDTDGVGADGVIVQSVGGGGGNGGLAITPAVSGGGTGAGSISVAVGGNGSAGGDGNTVDAKYSGTLVTRNMNSTGLLVQSVGGGGGNGGGSIAATIGAGGTGAGSVSVGLGGKGAGGGLGGAVKLETAGTVTTLMRGSSGIVAQSIGGGGGNGGFNVSAGIAGGGTGAGTVAVGLGGAAGGAGDAKKVESTIRSYVETRAADSTGVVIQSVGGGGGNGGMNVSGSLTGGGTGAGSVSVGLGGSGGAGGIGGEVVNAMYANLLTLGNNSGGLLVQSLGGGGGNGGLTVTASGALAGTGAGAASVGIGGSGGGGGRASKVTSLYEGIVATLGNNSTAITAQSIGGGGGNGAITVTGTLTGAGTGSGGASVGIGGSGGDASNGGEVDNTVNGNVFTSGSGSDGVLAQSVGGGGGNGGLTVTGTVSVGGTGTGAASVGIGGSGGGGGAGLKVTNTVTGNVITGYYDPDVVTTPDPISNSSGVIAQSIGGGGGNGGTTINGTFTAAGKGAGSASVGIGGSGGSGGAGGEIAQTVTGDVSVRGTDSQGVIAQSIGGGGGNGGVTVDGAVSLSGKGAGSVGVSIGGSGGDGGGANLVTNTVTGNVITDGDGGKGVVAQSLGGGGGNGGLTVTGSLTVSKAGGAVAVGIGGSGGSGASSGQVVNKVVGNVYTDGVDSDGIIAQSIAGGGGNGSVTIAGGASLTNDAGAAIGVGVGGSGGVGANAETVHNTLEGDVQTVGNDATGVLAQSVGGGGGNGGMSVAGTLAASLKKSGSVAVGVGGSGAGGGHGARVDNYVTGDVSTFGENSSGIIAQSIGGGGGNGGMNVTGSVNLSKESGGAIGVGVGGSGAGAGNGGVVFNQVVGDIYTDLKNSIGVLAQSQGGGGGNGGMNVTGTLALSTGSGSTSGSIGVGVGGMGGGGGTATTVTNNVTGSVRTFGDGSTAILGQSLGGGGGNGGMNIQAGVNINLKGKGGTVGVGVGGFGGDGGSSGDVFSKVLVEDPDGIIATRGDDAMGVVAQSIAGGGGNGGMNISAGLNYSDEQGGALNVGVGGFGGDGADNAGNVDLDVKANILTQGSRSSAVVAQSVGGGGGDGALNVSGGIGVSKAKSSTTATIGIGGFGGAGGDAGNVKVKYEGQINNPWADGDPDSDANGSHGIFAQSLAGGGGNGGMNISGGISYASDSDSKGRAIAIGIGGFGGAGGDAGEVDVDVTGGKSITAHGDEASAIFAQSLGGSGGNGGINVSGGITSDSPIVFGMGGFGGNGGLARKVTVDAIVDLYAHGYASTGITAQSLGGGGGNGALNVSGSASFNSQDSSSSLVFGIGGFGGDANVSGDVEVSHTGNIRTKGEWGHGILAQSLAGGGGNGGLNVAAGINGTKDDQNQSQDFSVVGGVGGFAGDGAVSGNVVVNSSGDIVTEGDYARGIFAQSVGGGGGTGGMNVSSNIARGTSPITMGIGGFGGEGGDAGNVSVTRGAADAAAGAIITNGMDAHGIEASSIGGGGGDAGMNFALSYSGAGAGKNDKKDKKDERSVPKHTGVDDSVIPKYNAVLDELEGRQKNDSSDPQGKKAYGAQLMIGGSGGAAGNGGDVDVHNFGDIETQGSSSHGVFAQSIGGGGGNASLNIAYSKADGVDKSLDVAIGGGTGPGGIGGNVIAEHQGTIITRGNNSVGVFAQSVGGGGGNAGMDMVSTSNSSGNLGVIIGRVGGTGGNGGTVSVDSDGWIETYGINSHGIQAQSVGNGGGNSSAITVSGSTPAGEDPEENPGKSGKISVGLEGGEGGFGGDVDVTAAGRIATRGDSAHGLFAQSVGGGGGNGGSTSLGSKNPQATKKQSYGIAVGGQGGSGGYGGLVDVDSSALITTEGESAIGILAQSVGGAGGTGGDSKRQANLKNNGNIAINIGGSGGSGMTGGDVYVTNDGVVVTDGNWAHAILAQTVGGGGGLGGMVGSNVYSSGSNSSSNVSILVGGEGGDSNDNTAGLVDVTNTGGIETFQANSIGIYAQSVGGAGGDAQAVTNRTVARGTGKSDQNNFNLAIGGAGGKGGIGGNVTVRNQDNGTDEYSGVVVTHGHGSHAIVAMSIGGGGGTGSSVTNIESSKMNGTTRSMSIGGSGGEGGHSGDVLVENGGMIITYGDKAHGILAQSVSGGGGNAGDVRTVNSRPEGSTAQAISIGGFGGGANEAGDVTVVNSGEITTYGNESHGIFAQSVGGGGGNGSMAVANPRSAASSKSKGSWTNSIGVGGIAGTGGDAGDVLVQHTGTITIEGDNSYGIYAQSVGGGGGDMGASLGAPVSSFAATGVQMLIGAVQGDGKAGTVTVEAEGDIIIRGSNSHAVFQQSVNGGGGNAEVFLDLVDSGKAWSEDSVDIEDNLSIEEHITNAVTDFVMDHGGNAVVDAVASAIDWVQNGAFFSFGDSANGSSLQAVGGGGGNSYIDIDHYEAQQINGESNLGGTDGSGNTGGDITGEHTGSAGVVGNGGVASSAQSIGGGGGRSVLVFKSREVPETPEVPPAPEVAAVAEASTAPVAAFAAPAAVPAAPAAPSGVVETSARIGAVGGVGNDGGSVDMRFNRDTVTLGDRSLAVVLQSIGAGGGQQLISGADIVNILLGGSDGAQGDGKAVTLENTGLVQTDGELAHGMVLQSIGGGGGLVLTDTDSDDVNVGLNDDNAGDGDQVDLVQTGNVMIYGDRSYGILAQSIGGGGGAVDDKFFGYAGGAGTASDVNLNITGTTVIYGDRGVGMFGQSAARDGAGDVMFDIRGDIGAAGDYSTGLKGRSDSEADSGEIGVSLAGYAFASGDYSTGIDLALIGKDSTNDINVSAWGLTASGDYAIALKGLTSADAAGSLNAIIRDFVVASGDGARGIAFTADGGNSAGQVNVSVGRSVVASGAGARGVVGNSQAEGSSGALTVSVGSNLRASGDNARALVLGGNGGTGTGNVAARIDGDVSASGQGATGILATAAGGGAPGTVSARVGGDVSASGAGSTGVRLFSRGSGGGDQRVSVSGDVVSGGEGATGVRTSSTGSSTTFRSGGSVVAQGDNATGIDLDAPAGSVTATVGAALAVDGNGAVGVRGTVGGGSAELTVDSDVLVNGDGASATDLRTTTGVIGVRVRGNLATAGEQASGIVAVAEAEGRAGSVDLELVGDMNIGGQGSRGIALSSKGGTRGGRVNAAIGGNVVGFGGDMSVVDLLSTGILSGDKVSLSVDGGLVSAGDGATLVRLRSEGGERGGALDFVTRGDLHVMGAGSLGLSGRSIANDRSGAITAAVSGAVIVEGDASAGIDLQSKGGASSGNIGAQIDEDLLVLGDDARGVTLQSLAQPLDFGELTTVSALANAPAASVAGDVSLVIGGDSLAEGDAVRGIEVRSEAISQSGDVTVQIDGDAGVYGDGGRALIASSASGGSAAGDVTVRVGGDVLLDGDGVTGLWLGSSTAGEAGSLLLDLGGDVIAEGTKVIAIRALTDGTSGGDITINTAEGATLYAGEDSTIIRMDGAWGSNNVLALNGPVSTADGLLGTPVVAIAGNDVVNNADYYLGQVDLSEGVNRFSNNGLFVAGPQQSVGDAGVLVNNGDLVIGGDGFAQPLSLSGSFVQSAGAVTWAEVDFATDSMDQVLATGTADLDGEVVLNILSPERAPAGDFSRVLFGGAQGVSDNGLELVTNSTLVMDYQLDFTDDAALLNYSLDFAPEWLGDNTESVGEYINRVQNAGSSEALADTIVTLLYETDPGSYASRLSGLVPDFYGEQQVQLIKASQVFGERMLSCKQAGGQYHFIAEGSCSWVYVGFENLERDESSDNFGAEFESELFTIGSQWALGEGWFAGVAGSYESVDGDGNNDLWASDGKTIQFGASVKYQPGPWKAAAVFTYGVNDTDIDRAGQVVESVSASSQRDTDSIGLLLSGSYGFEFESAYVRPGLQLGMNYLDADDVEENGAGELSLELEGGSDTYTWVRPVVESGYEYVLSGETRARLYARLGLQHYLGDDYVETSAGLAGVNLDVQDMRTEMDLGQDSVQGLIGLDFLFTNDMVLQLQYGHESADRLTRNAGQVKFSMKF